MTPLRQAKPTQEVPGVRVMNAEQLHGPSGGWGGAAWGMPPPPPLPFGPRRGPLLRVAGPPSEPRSKANPYTHSTACWTLPVPVKAEPATKPKSLMLVAALPDFAPSPLPRLMIKYLGVGA